MTTVADIINLALRDVGVVGDLDGGGVEVDVELLGFAEVVGWVEDFDDLEAELLMLQVCLLEARIGVGAFLEQP